jgi:membrane associated rhomboid family serine protease/cytochrome c-type biogenesis protein CcmH/NrfG
MLHCSCCGIELPTDSDNEPGALCTVCSHAMETGEDLARPLTKPVTQKPVVRFPVTQTLILVNVAVFAAMGFPINGLSHSQLLKWGADWGPLTLDGQWWRMFTSMFVHDGLKHIVPNMLGLWMFGKMVERNFGTWLFLCMYAISGVTAAVTTLAFHPEVIHCGASGAIFGLLGAIISSLYFSRLPEVAANYKRQIWPLLAYTAYSVYAGAMDRTVNNAAHAGGLLAGLIMGAVLCRNVIEPAKLRLRLFAAAAMVLLIATFVVERQNGWVITLRHASDALAADKLDDASRYLMMVLQKRPTNVSANVIMGAVFLQKADYAHAEASLKRALAVDPRNNSAEYFLGLVKLRTGRFDEALDSAMKLIQSGANGVEEQELYSAALEGKGEHALAGDRYLKLRRYDEAIVSYKAAIRQKPDDEHSKRGLEQALSARGLNDKAEATEGSTSPSNGSSQRPKASATPRL